MSRHNFEMSLHKKMLIKPATSGVSRLQGDYRRALVARHSRRAGALGLLPQRRKSHDHPGRIARPLTARRRLFVQVDSLISAVTVNSERWHKLLIQERRWALSVVLLARSNEDPVTASTTQQGAVHMPAQQVEACVRRQEPSWQHARFPSLIRPSCVVRRDGCWYERTAT